MRLGGLARYVIELETVEDVEKAYLFAKERQLPVFILGTGSNVIGKDEGFKGVILLNRIKGIRFIDELTIDAMGGELLDDLVAFTTKKNLSGIEALSAIPGTVGAAPVQTEEEFAQTLDFIRKCRFAQMHIFPYSIRPGTPAAKMEQVPKAVKEERARRAAAVAEEMHRSYLEGCVGRTYPVLFEQPKNGKFFGHAPNYMEVLAEGENLHNQLRNVRITAVEGDTLLGELQED